MVLLSNRVLPLALMSFDNDLVGVDAGVSVLFAEGSRLTCLNVRRAPPYVDIV